MILTGSSLIASTQANAMTGSTLPRVAATSEAESEATFEELDFSHPVSLESALSVTEAAGLPVLGYHFESDSITGDFWPDGGMSADDFLAKVAAKSGTAPEVVGAYVDAGLYEERTSESRGFVAPLLGEELPAFDAPDANPELAVRDLPEKDSDVSSMAAGDTWQPKSAEVMITPMEHNLEIIAKYSWWGSDPYNSPLVMADHWGMEFQIDFYSSRVVNSPLPPPHLRPNCGPTGTDYKDWAAASTRPYNWWGWVIVGTSQVPAPASLGLYGDFNDLEDPCKVSTIAVGMANPSAMPVDSWYENFLDIHAYPHKGQETQSTVGAIVQPVSRAHCEAFPSMPLMDCMGVTPGVYPGPGTSQNRMVLNSNNGHKAPSLCWSSGDFGTVPAMIWDSCFW